MAACLLLTACGAPLGPATAPTAPAASQKLDKVRFLAGYKAQANVSFVGPYVAQAKGFYRDAQLDVDIEHVARTGENFKQLAAGDVDVTTGVGEDVIRLVQAGMPLVAIASVTQRGDHGFASLASSGIKQPKQWEGRTAGYKGAGVAIDYLALVNKLGLDRSKIKEVQIGYDARALTEKTVDILPVFLSNEPDAIRTQLGLEVNVIDPADYGVVLLGQTWLVNSKQLAAKRALYERWLRASVKGLEYAFEHENEAVDVVLKYAPEENQPHQGSMLSVEKKNSLTDVTRTNGLGWMTPEPWSTTQDALIQTGQITSKLDVTSYFDNQLLEALHRA